MDPRDKSLRDLLAFYAEAGGDEALVEEAPNRFQQEQRPAPARTTGQDGGASSGSAAQRSSPASMPAAAQLPDRPRPDVAVPDEAQVALARQRAATAATLEELREIMANFEGCNLRYTAKNL